MLIEQAIFASAVTERTQGYQLLSRSPGLSEADAREIAAWAPSHDSLLSRGGKAVSVNFQRLESGNFLVSRTTEAGAEYSGRGGATVRSHFFVVPPEILLRFGNNPFALLRAATAAGAIKSTAAVPETLDSLRLGGKSAAVDVALLAQIARKPGPAAMATFIQTVLATDRVAVACAAPLESVIAAFIGTLPVECRTEFSFSTGLRFSARRAGRISALGEERSTWKAVARQGVTLLDLDSLGGGDALEWQGWAGYVAHALAAGSFSQLANELSHTRPGLKVSQLDGLADEISKARTPRASVLKKPAEPCGEPAILKIARPEEDERPIERHPGGGRTIAATAAEPSDTAATLADHSPETLELLEQVDDLVFAAIGGDQRALEELEVVWPTVQDELEPDVVEQSREQYLKCALSIWSECVEGEAHRPDRAVAAIDVLCVLFED